MKLTTVFGETVRREEVLSEYPRPQLVRESYLNLNGPWDYAITKGDEEPRDYDGLITVPFSPECPLSGVDRMLMPDETLWYRRGFTLSEGFNIGRVILHFGAVDQEACVYVNGVEAAHHIGGYTPFSADITDMLQEENHLTVKVKDLTDSSERSRGKQKMKRGGIWYTPQSGIWQTVWMESVPREYIESIRMTPLYDSAELELTVMALDDIACRARVEGRAYEFFANTPIRIPMDGFRPWSPEDPFLYDIEIKLGQDSVRSYFAMRKVESSTDCRGVRRLFLNGAPYFHNGLLDQGYWPDGLYTAPSDEALEYDIKLMKHLGFNMLRKHIKIEPLRWYYHCDRLGMLVWQDMPSGGGSYKPLTVSAPLVTGVHHRDNSYSRFSRTDAECRAQYYTELADMVKLLYNCPSVVMWVPFNEGWGQFDSQKAVELIQSLDVTRTIDHASGWHDQGISDVKSLHVYFKPFKFKPDKKGRAVVLSEFGGYNLRIDGHCMSEKDFGYKRFNSSQTLLEAYIGLYEREIIPAAQMGLAAAVYTQVSDVEQELNGLVTYDRKELKLPERELRELNKRLMDSANQRV